MMKDDEGWWRIMKDYIDNIDDIDDIDDGKGLPLHRWNYREQGVLQPYCTQS